MIRFPALHRFAIYWGVHTERLSILVEDHLRQQMYDLPIPSMDTEAMYELVKHSKYVSYHNDTVGYEMEDYID